MERTPAGQLLIDTHKQAKKMPCNALHWASLRTYTPFAISALNLIYIHFIIFAFSATPTQPRPPLPYPVLPCAACLHPFEVISGNRPWLFFLLLLFRVALMNSNVCVIELLKFHWTAPARTACQPSVPTRFLRGVQAKISLWIWQHFYIFVYFNLWPSAVQFISRAKCKWGENEAW